MHFLKIKIKNIEFIFVKNINNYYLCIVLRENFKDEPVDNIYYKKAFTTL